MQAISPLIPLSYQLTLEIKRNEAELHVSLSQDIGKILETHPNSLALWFFQNNPNILLRLPSYIAVFASHSKCWGCYQPAANQSQKFCLLLNKEIGTTLLVYLEWRYCNLTRGTTRGKNTLTSDGVHA